MTGHTFYMKDGTLGGGRGTARYTFRMLGFLSPPFTYWLSRSNSKARKKHTDRTGTTQQTQGDNITMLTASPPTPSSQRSALGDVTNTPGRQPASSIEEKDQSHSARGGANAAFAESESNLQKWKLFRLGRERFGRCIFRFISLR